MHFESPRRRFTPAGLTASPFLPPKGCAGHRIANIIGRASLLNTRKAASSECTCPGQLRNLFKELDVPTFLPNEVGRSPVRFTVAISGLSEEHWDQLWKLVRGAALYVLIRKSGLMPQKYYFYTQNTVLFLMDSSGIAAPGLKKANIKTYVEPIYN